MVLSNRHVYVNQIFTFFSARPILFHRLFSDEPLPKIERRCAT